MHSIRLETVLAGVAPVEVEMLLSARMAKPDRPNFSLPARILFGVIALIVIATLLRFFGYA
jgi:hypothetical protein